MWQAISITQNYNQNLTGLSTQLTKQPINRNTNSWLAIVNKVFSTSTISTTWCHQWMSLEKPENPLY
jgi:hypothetical protein